MPALRLATRRRRSSHAIFTPAKAGIYGIPQRPVTFAPNVTPITFTEVDPDDDPTNPLSSYALAAALGNPAATGLQLTSKLFPPSETPAPPPTRKRCPPGKRRSQGYIPRPPNAFMLFRADFVRQKHVPGSIETNHGSLSKIIGTCWRQLPLEEKRVWEVKAKQEKAAHKAMFPDYRFRPVHNKNKNGAASSASASSPSSSATNAASADRDDTNAKRKEKQPTTAEDERRCDEVAQLLLEGKKGEELARAVRSLDRARSLEREREMMEDYDLELEQLGLEMGLGADEGEEDERDDFGGASQQESTLHMPVSQHAHAFSMSGNSYASSFMHHGMNTNMGMGIPPNMHTPAHLHPHANNHAMYHRRPSSVPLPNEWQSYVSYSQSYSSGNGSGIALPTVPHLSRAASPVGSIARFAQQQQGLGFQQQQQQGEQFTNPFAPSSSSSTTPSTGAGAGTGDYEFAPIPGFTPAGASFFPQTQPQLFHPVPVHHHSHSLQNASYVQQQGQQQQPQAQQGGYPLLPFMTQTTPRSSLGLGQRRASSAQGVLMRAWTMPLSMGDFDYTSMGYAANMGGMQVERDPSPLPDVESGLFSDFSFGSSGSGSGGGSGRGSERSDALNPGSDVHATPPSQSLGLGLGLGLDIAIPPTALARIDTSVNLADYSPTQVPPSSISTSSSEGASPVSAAGGGLPETPATTTAGGSSSSSTMATHDGKESQATAPGRMDSLDMSAYMHFDGDNLYAAPDSSYDVAQQQQQYHHQEYQQGYYAYDVDPVAKNSEHEHEHEHEAFGAEGGYYAASA